MTPEQQRVAQADQRIAAARARVERMGGTLHVVGAAPGFIIVAQSCWSRDLPDIETVEAWLQQVEGRR